LIVVTVGELSKRYPRAGALLLSLPLMSILAFIVGWLRFHDLQSISQLARDTLILVPLGLPFFVPFSFASRLVIGFWPAFGAGIGLASLTIGAWLWISPAK